MGYPFEFKHRVIMLVKAERFIPVGEQCEGGGDTPCCPYLKEGARGVGYWCAYLKRALARGRLSAPGALKPCGVKLDPYS